MVTFRDRARANARAAWRKAHSPGALRARYDVKNRKIVVDLARGLSLVLAPEILVELRGATVAELSRIEISPSGYGLHFPALDADIYVPALLESIAGSRTLAAKKLGAQGGRSRSEAKSRAARANGALGGRPKKN